LRVRVTLVSAPRELGSPPLQLLLQLDQLEPVAAGAGLHLRLRRGGHLVRLRLGVRVRVRVRVRARFTVRVRVSVRVRVRVGVRIRVRVGVTARVSAAPATSCARCACLTPSNCGGERGRLTWPILALALTLTLSP